MSTGACSLRRRPSRVVRVEIGVLCWVGVFGRSVFLGVV